MEEWTREKLYKERKSNARRCVKVMGLDVFLFYFIFLSLLPYFPFTMIVVPFSLM